jgi:transcriptional enhancer factor
LEGAPVEGSPQHQDVLQDRSAAQSYKSHNSTALPRLGQKGSVGLSENASVQHSITTGAYCTDNVHAQHIGLASFGFERSEKQIRFELGRLYKLLQRSEKYQTYREKQPALTPAEVVAQDTAERKEQEKRKAQGLQQEKDKTVWPDFLEHAFWIGKTMFPLHYS